VPGYRPSHDATYFLPVARLTLTCLLFFGCATAEARRDDDPKLVASISALVSADSVPGTDEPTSDKDDADLRRSYVAKDMKVHRCVTANDEGNVLGKECPSALVVFGPYVTVPSNSDVRLKFDIMSPGPLTVMSDVLSDGAKRFHAAIEEEHVAANEARTISYRIHVFDGVRSLESRIGVRGDSPVDFEIKNLKLTVE
jgi:hypothetical protein